MCSLYRKIQILKRKALEADTFYHLKCFKLTKKLDKASPVPKAENLIVPSESEAYLSATEGHIRYKLCNERGLQ